MNAKHSPAPWRYSQKLRAIYGAVDDRPAADGRTLARLAEDATDDDGRIFAEAPAMYEVLREIADDPTGHQAHRKLARAILARIEGSP